VTRPTPNHCIASIALVSLGLGLGLGLYTLSEILAAVIVSAAVISLLALAIVGGFLVWQGAKRIADLTTSWKWTRPLRRPVVLANVEGNG
jgi:uncharacterized membrane protein